MVYRMCPVDILVQEVSQEGSGGVVRHAVRLGRK